MAANKPPRKKMELSEEERERRRQTAIKLRKEGRFGGKQKGAGRPKKRAQAEVVEGIRDDAPKILAALRRALKSNSESVSLKAALAMLDIERQEETHIAKQDQREYEKMAKDELLAIIKKKVNELQDSGVNFQDLIIGQAKELPPKKVANEENG